MSIHDVTVGNRVPQEFNVIIEIPGAADPVKYEVDKQSGALFVDRFMMTSMHYPANYGYVPRTIADDDDPVGVLVHTPLPSCWRFQPTTSVPCSRIGKPSPMCRKSVSSRSSISSSITRISKRASG